MLYGHTLSGQPEANWQTLEEHLRKTSSLAKAFASAFGAKQTAALLGSIHDDGKRSKEFQNRLRHKGGRVDHSTAAGQHLQEVWATGQTAEGNVFAKLLAYALLGHHGGMPNYGTRADGESLEGRLSKSIPEWHHGEIPAIPAWEALLSELSPLFCVEPRKPDAFAVSFMIRMLYSCLVDADFLDTERFCSPDRHGLRPVWPGIAELDETLHRRLREKGFLADEPVTERELLAGAGAACGSEVRTEGIRLARQQMLRYCLEAAELSPGLFSLIMPTGGGKTLASLAFALRHAKRHGLRRVILVVPYTSIIEQNADVFREVLGEDAVLEHHSNYVHPAETALEDEGDAPDAIAYRLSTENWDATIIVTTSVQFFESLFAHRPSRCRKIHAIAQSVVILDEVQMIPVPFVAPCVAVLRLLARNYGSSIVLCTATQPAFMQSESLPQGFLPDEVRDIVPAGELPLLFRLFQRTTVEDAGVLNNDELAKRLLAERQVLCIVNSRAHARELFACLGDAEEHFHLSARMTPEHRSKVLKAVCLRLKQGQPCRLISTSLIECGVDIDFPVVFREKNGLDVLAQSAGRCNREGRLEWGRVFYFQSDKGLPKRAADLSRRCRAFDELGDRTDLLCPETVRDYFRILYSRSRLDEKEILSHMEKKNAGKLPHEFDFSSIAKQFQFIDDQTERVIIENEDSVPLLSALGERPNPVLLRRLQRFSVQVYLREFAQLRRDGRIEDRYGFLHVVSGGVGYDKKTGLDVALKNGVPVDDLLW